ncbi:aromatic ring-hydroxylating dioxygenase subunit alpha [Paraburkholderia sprentiae WSM5005]|uniref:Aromatic ring-hydroxylating dioxygenase subunit alpha n=1 Tax=Paraburkholderia sprentiae WSM5005 TaxID=754502 RepID=A0A1I9YEL2_9BURK|nr:Rieske 2Fe-2S domain-containing protein [Paraburkholderia sprentiae]APA84745.1 aromatic ring-hydroxylating dioxygenase subunit alpha [Paraburkholderia sprentiae WSM5005]
MLSREDNDVLTQVGKGTPNGDMIRQFWIPMMLASEISEPGGKPVRVRLLGEDLVAFRDSDGKVGLLEEQCPHRRASLALGDNSDGGLRCLYHGWKFAVDGQCMDTPTEPEDSKLCSRIKAVAYPTREVAGVIWTYMGDPAKVPQFPDFDFLSYPAEKVVAFKVLEDCNYAQAVEGTIDSAHAGVLHREQPWAAPAKYEHERDLRPKIEVEYTHYGLRYAGVRNFREEGKLHARVTQVVLPFFTLIPPDGFGVRKNRRMANAFVPRDDESTWHIQWFFDETQPVDIEYRIQEGGHWLDENFRKELNIDNWYKQDREAMKTTSMSGIKGILTQDHAVSETQGRILDRTKEHLGTSDVAVVAWRRQMIRAARAYSESGELPSVLTTTIPWNEIHASTVIFPNDRTWKEEVPLNPEVALKA